MSLDFLTRHSIAKGKDPVKYLSSHQYAVLIILQVRVLLIMVSTEITYDFIVIRGTVIRTYFKFPEPRRLTLSYS